MSPEERKHREEFRKGVQAALLRAADRAREIARRTNTPLIYADADGNVIEEFQTDKKER